MSTQDNDGSSSGINPPTTFGFWGDTNDGIGVLGTSNTTNGISGDSNSGVGVFGRSNSGAGVLGRSSTAVGVQGTSASGIGVGGGSNSGDGVRGGSVSSNGVFGENESTDLIHGGIHGRNTRGGLAGVFDGPVQVNGNFSATGTKNFVQAHPTNPNQEIVYVALEGGEAGTYVRGSGQLESGKAVLALPEHFGLVTASEGLSIQLTPRGEWLQLYVVELDTAQLIVREAQGKSGRFDYFICGVRRGYEQHEVFRTKR